MQFTTSNIPTNITTVESLVAWGLSALYAAHGGDRVLEIENTPPTPAVEYTLINAPGGTLRIVGRISLECSKNILSSTTAKPWTQVAPFTGNVAIPTGFLP